MRLLFSPLQYKAGHWNRKIVNIFWLVVFLSFIQESVSAFFTKQSPMEYFTYNVGLPTFLLSLISAASELVLYKSVYRSDYILITSAGLMSGVLMGVHPHLQSMISCLFFPILISVSYFHLKKIWYSFSISAGIYLLLLFIEPAFQELNNWPERISVFTILITIAFVCEVIMHRGREIGHHLKKAQEDHMDLVVKSAIMEKQVKTDALTGLYNHMAFYEFLDVLLLQAETYHYPVHLAVIDIDNFKIVNDTYGHGTGDLVLKRVARTIKSQVAVDDFVARYGGEEFVILLNGISEADAFQKMEAIRTKIMQHKHPELNGNHVTVSIGLRSYVSGMHKLALFEEADANLYTAKRSGKNKIVQSRKEAAFL